MVVEIHAWRRPLGLVLAGGGAHGSWQAGCLAAWSRAGLVFDKVLGFSAGALSGTAYFLGREDDLVERWSDVDRLRLLRLKPRLRPLSLFSGEPFYEAVAYTADEERAKRAGRCELLVVSLCLEDGLPHYARFTPQGSAGWDGPLTARLAASCAIPLIFPPVRIGTGGGARTFVDGGVPGREWLRFDALSDCRDLIVVQMIRPDEAGGGWWPIAFDGRGRELIRRQMLSGLKSLGGLKVSPRVFSFYPSKRLDFSMLTFRTTTCAPAVDLGFSDGEAFLREPERHLLSSIPDLPPRR